MQCRRVPIFLPQNSQCFLEGNPLQPRKILLPVIWPEDGSTSISFAFSFLLLLPNARIYSLTSAPRLYLIFNLVILRFDNCSTLLNAMPFQILMVKKSTGRQYLCSSIADLSRAQSTTRPNNQQTICSIEEY